MVSHYLITSYIGVCDGLDIKIDASLARHNVFNPVKTFEGFVCVRLDYLID